jgi:homoserine dehydrogenase
MKTINIALLGFGTVGSGVYNAIKSNEEKLKKEFNANLIIKKILVSDKTKKRAEDINPNIFTDNFTDVITDDIDLVVEVMGSMDFAKKCILAAFERGKHVVSANKDLIATYGQELYKAAYENNCFFMYEASVCGGIPILRVINNHLFGEKIEKITGIMNGTTNYILSKMYQEGLEYKDVLSEAQRLGYAEADPTSDVEGYDSARKVAILSSLCFNTYVTFKDVYTEGITNITKQDISYAKKMGYNIKLLGVSKENDGKIEAYVYPAFIPNTCQISNVKDAYNAVYLKSNLLGESMYYAKGAGSLPTASAVLSDIVNIVKNMSLNLPGERLDRNFEKKEILSIDEIFTKYYLRIGLKSNIDISSEILSIFENMGIGVVKNIKEDIQNNNTIIVITEKVKESKIKQCIESLKNLNKNLEIGNMIRIEDDI